MLFRIRYNVLFRQFRLLTAQAGSIPAAIRLIFENCYKTINYKKRRAWRLVWAEKLFFIISWFIYVLALELFLHRCGVHVQDVIKIVVGNHKNTHCGNYHKLLFSKGLLHQAHQVLRHMLGVTGNGTAIFDQQALIIGKIKGGKSSEITSMVRALNKFSGVDANSIHGISSAVSPSQLPTR